MRSVLAFFNSLSGAVHKSVVVFCITVIIVMIVDTLLGVFFRYVLDNPLKWPEELARLLMVWAGLMGVTIALKEGEHIGIEVVLATVSDQVRIYLTLLVNLLVLLFLVVLFLWGCSVTINAQETLPALQIPWMWSFMAVPVSAAVQLIHLMAHIIDDISKIKIGTKANTAAS